MGVVSYLKSRLSPSSLKTGSFTVSPTFREGSKGAFIAVPTYNPSQSKRDREFNRIHLSLWEQIEKLSWEDQTVSHGVWSTVRGASQAYWVSLKSSRGKVIKAESRKKEALMAVLRGNSRNPDGSKFDFRVSLEGVRQQMLRSVKLYGAIAAEAVLDKDRQPMYIKVVNPNSIKFKEPSKGKYVPYQETVNGHAKSEISLDYPNFFWVRLDPVTNGPYARSPLEPVVNTIYFQMGFLEDLQEVVKKTAWPRISAKLMEDVIYERLPPEIQNDMQKLDEHMRAHRAGLATTLQNLEPGQAFVAGNYVELSILESAGQSKGTLNPAPLLEVVERHSAQAMKTFASVLGVTGDVDPLQQFMENQSLKGYQSVVEDCMSAILTFFYRATGQDVIAEFKHRSQELRPDSELEPARAMKMSTDKTLLMMGMITPEDMSLSMTGTPLPEDSKAHELYNRIDLVEALNGGQQESADDETPDPSDTDDSGKAPAKPSDDKDGRSSPEASSKRGKTPAKKKTGEVKTTRKGTSRKPRSK